MFLQSSYLFLHFSDLIANHLSAQGYKRWGARLAFDARDRYNHMDI